MTPNSFWMCEPPWWKPMRRAMECLVLALAICVVALMLAGCGGGAFNFPESEGIRTEAGPTDGAPVGKPETAASAPADQMPPAGDPLWAIPPDRSPLWQVIGPAPEAVKP